MKRFSQVMAFVVAGLVVVQVLTVAAGIFSLMALVDGGGVLSAQLFDNGPAPAFEAGFSAHASIGLLLVPVAVVYFVSALIARVPTGRSWAGAVLVLTVLQVAMGLLAHAVTGLGLAHGLVAMALFATALLAGLRLRGPAHAPVPVDRAPATTKVAA